MPDDSLFIFRPATGRRIDNLRMTGLPLRVWQLSVAGVFATVAAARAPLAAQAHVGSQSIPDAAYYRTELSEVTPLPAGVTVRVDPGGDWVELSDTGEATVIVLGYSGEPYLRVTPTGVAENQLSQTTYLNRSLFADARRPIPEWLLATVEAGALGLVLAVGLGLARRRRGIAAGR
jgi:hypothetical protein